MNHIFFLHTYLLFIGFVFSLPCEIFADPAPLVLLKGVENARMKCEPIKVSFTTQYIGDADYGTITLSSLAEVSDSSRRFEVFPASNLNIFPGSVSILVKGEVNHFRRSKFSGVRYYGFNDAIRYADLIYDPKILGLVDNPTADKTVRTALCYDVYNKHSLIGREKINGIDVWHIRCVQDDSTTADFWIEEPSFRVHRKQIKTARLELVIDSKFDSKSVGPFPSEFHIERFEDNKQVFNRIVHIDELVYGKSIPPERFTLASMDLPLNTDVVDYRINRRLGYWDGEKLVDDPVRISAQELRKAMEPQKKGWINYLFMGIGGALILWALLRVLIKRGNNLE